MIAQPAAVHGDRSSILDNGISDNKVQTGFSPVAEDLKDVYFSTSYHYFSPITRATSKQKFNYLALTWKRDTRFNSSAANIATHPAYQQIIGMGKEALPYIFQRLMVEPTHWFWALHSITGINPVKPENRGNLPKMTEDWINWGIKNGIIRA